MLILSTKILLHSSVTNHITLLSGHQGLPGHESVEGHRHMVRNMKIHNVRTWKSKEIIVFKMWRGPGVEAGCLLIKL